MENAILLVGFISVPLVLIIVGALMWRFPPSPNGMVGYKTARAQRSNEAWYAAQTTSGKYMLFSNIPVLVLSIIAGLMPILTDMPEADITRLTVLVTAVQVLVIFGVIIATEIYLAKKFK